MAIETKELLAAVRKHPMVVGCGVLSMLLIIGIYYRSGRAGRLADQLHQKEQKGQRILDERSKGANLSEQYERLTKEVKDLESRLVVSSERARNQQYFYRIESETGVTEVNLQPSTGGTMSGKKRKSTYTKVGFDVTVKGDFRQILGFLRRLENGRHFYRLLTASVTRRGVRGGPDATNTLTLTLKLVFLGVP